MDAAFSVDQDRMVFLRRSLHEYPEIGWELERTVQLVCQELEDIGIPFSAHAYGKNTVVADIGHSGFTIALRADMDALPIQQAPSDKPYRSKIDGQMHACGHDAHTAMLLGTARTLWGLRGKLRCRVRLIFQPSEESRPSGARVMCEHGVMDGVDCIAMCHVNCGDQTHVLSSCAGITNATSCGFDIRIKGKSAHVAAPDHAVDALMIGVKVYTGIQMMLARELSPFDVCVMGVSQMNAGETKAAVAGYCTLSGSLRCMREELRDKIQARVSRMVASICEDAGGQGHVEFSKEPLPPAHNDSQMYQWFLETAAKVVGPEQIKVLQPSTGGEDFAYYQQNKPGLLFGLGMRNEEKGFVYPAHSPHWDIDEAGLSTGARTMIQFVLDHMDGFPIETE